MMTMPRIRPESLEEARKVVRFALGLTAMEKTRREPAQAHVSTSESMTELWGRLTGEQQYLVLTRINNMIPEDERHKRLLIEVVGWIRNYYYGILNKCYPGWDDTTISTR